MTHPVRPDINETTDAFNQDLFTDFIHSSSAVSDTGIAWGVDSYQQNPSSEHAPSVAPSTNIRSKSVNTFTEGFRPGYFECMESQTVASIYRLPLIFVGSAQEKLEGESNNFTRVFEVHRRKNVVQASE